MFNILVGQSGGPSCAINASLAGVIKARTALLESSKSESFAIDKVYGTIGGIQGVLDDNIVELTKYADDESISILKQTPAMALGSCRVKLPALELDPELEVYKKIEKTLSKYNIKYFFYIGGNDSMDTVLKLDRYFKTIGADIHVVGIPKTIDNDLCVTDHTPGYGSSARYLCNTLTEIHKDSRIYPVPNVVIVEIMGRNAGWLTLASAMPYFLGEDYPHIIALPEVSFDEGEFIDTIKRLLPIKKTVIAVVSEGIKDSRGQYVGMVNKSGIADSFGHLYLGGTGKYLENLVMKEIGCKVRSIELNVLQRCSSHLASKTDIDESYSIGLFAVVDAIAHSKTGVTYLYKRTNNSPYTVEFESCDVDLIANMEKNVPKRWQDVYDKQVGQEIKEYILPLMQGFIDMRYDDNGLPLHISFCD